MAVIHRDARGDFGAYKVADVFDRCGIRVVSIHTDPNYTSNYKIWGQSEGEIDTKKVDEMIENWEERKYWEGGV